MTEFRNIARFRNIACVNGKIYVQKEDGTLEKIVMEDVAKEKWQNVKKPEVRAFNALPIWDRVLNGEKK